jgi:Sec-independent protein translocase protein TatA
LYAQFTSPGTLDVPGTLLLIAKRFEKLMKWTMGHVRALEDRMNDVEGWLVDKEASKEKEKEKEKESESVSLKHASSTDNMKDEIHDPRDEAVELQGRLGDLGRRWRKLSRRLIIFLRDITWWTWGW